MKVLIDTDPGLDDAIAILFALAHPQIEVTAITAVAGNIGLEVTTANALKLVAFAGTETPVIAGAAAPLARPGVEETAIHGEDGLGGVTLPEAGAAQRTDAPAYLAETLLAQPPGTFDLLALGPLTNLALLLREAPEAARRLGRVIAMGGAIREPGNMGPRAEFNLHQDPEAAQAVLEAGLDLTLIPLDVTRQVRADAAWLDRLAKGSPQARLARDLVAAYFDSTTDAERPTSRPLHDPCVPVLALCPDLFGLEPMSLTVDCTEADPGALNPGPHPVKVAMQVNSAAVLDLLVATLG